MADHGDTAALVQQLTLKMDEFLHALCELEERTDLLEKGQSDTSEEAPTGAGPTVQRESTPVPSRASAVDDSTRSRT